MIIDILTGVVVSVAIAGAYTALDYLSYRRRRARRLTERTVRRACRGAAAGTAIKNGGPVPTWREPS
jgi:hypothetical protein